MLVHPDKNMGNENAAEALKKLQHAYEVLMDSIRHKEYDDELRREELLSYFRKFQNTSHKPWIAVVSAPVLCLHWITTAASPCRYYQFIGENGL